MVKQFAKDEDIDLTSINRIEDVTPCENYGTLWQQILRINRPLLNIATRNASTATTESDRVRLLKSIKTSSKDNSLEKTLYGIVVEYKHNKGVDPEIYVDIPGKFFNPTQHPDDYIDESIGSIVDSSNRFYYQDQSAFSKITPKIGGIAIVKVASNFPNHSLGDAKNNKFIGMVNNIFYVPIKNIKLQDIKTNLFNSTTIDPVTGQPTLRQNAPPGNSSKSGTTSSKPSNRPKLLLTDFECDLASYVSLGERRGNQFIKVREDIQSDLKFIKNNLNAYGIPFTCIASNYTLQAKNVSDLSRIGLEIQLNPSAGLYDGSAVNRDDYYVGPDHSKPLGKYFKFKIYGNVRRKTVTFPKYTPIKKEIEIYDVTQTYLKNKPKIIKIFGEFIDISQIFFDLGFKQYNPSVKFFDNSNIIESKWNIFYKPLKINFGYSYKELLETVFYKNNEEIWKEKEKYWDGERFVWRQ